MPALIRAQGVELLMAYYQGGMHPVEAWRALHPERAGSDYHTIRQIVRNELKWYFEEYRARKEDASPFKALTAGEPRPPERSVEAPARKKERKRCAGTEDRKCKTRVRGRRKRCRKCSCLKRQAYNKQYYQANRPRLSVQRRERLEKERQDRERQAARKKQADAIRQILKLCDRDHRLDKVIDGLPDDSLSRLHRSS